MPTSVAATLEELGRDQAEVYEWTHLFVLELWREAVQHGLAINKDGLPMKAAAAAVAKAFLAEFTVRKGKDPGALPEHSPAHWHPVGLWLRAEVAGPDAAARWSIEDFEDFVPEYWRRQLARVTDTAAVRLIRQLGGDNSIGWLRHMAGSEPSGLFRDVLAWRAELPEAVLLVQVGDFFEAWGADAVMLVQWCGLRPMGRRPRAGFPASAASLQQCLDRLTGAELSAAVYVQIGEPGKSRQPRVLRQVVTPGTPTYLYAHELGRIARGEAQGEFAEGRPFVAIRLRVDGLLYAELWPFRREVRFHESVTPEGAEALLAGNDGVAWPVLVDGPRGSFRWAAQWPWFPEQRRWLGLPPEVGDSQFLEACCQFLCDSLNLPREPGFQSIRLDSGEALQPLSLASAQNLGVLPRRGVPSLVDHMISTDASGATRRLLRRWLLAPRSSGAVSAMRELLHALLAGDRLSLPSFQRVPSVARLSAYIGVQTASERLFRDLRSCCVDARALLGNPRCSGLLGPLLALTELETGEEAMVPEALLADLGKVVGHIDAHVLNEASAEEAYAPQGSELQDHVMQHTLSRFLEANELYSGVASPVQETVAAAFSQVAKTRQELFASLREAAASLQPGSVVDALVYNPFDNDLCFKAKPQGAVGALDRRGSAKRHRFTTPRLRQALLAYVLATRAAEAAVQESLSELCVKLRPFMTALRSVISMAELLVCASRHASHAAACGWSLAELSSTGVLNVRAAAYWLGPDGVSSQVALDRRGAILTGPNMSGKSTMLRAVGAAVLLANCGFLSPCEGSVPRYRQISFLSPEGDRPAEGASAFGQEARASGALLRRACASTLALVDELGRGTEPSAATACVGALVEELAGRGCHYIIATHLHGVTDLSLRLPPGRARPQLWRMGMSGGVQRARADAAPVWTYNLEQGVCRDSFAGLTLRQFGWPDAGVDRFLQLLDSCKYGNREEGREAKAQGNSGTGTPAATEALLLAALCEISGCSEGDVARIGPGEAPPVPMSESVAVLYVLLLRDGRVYVGQTAHLAGRLKSHRVRFRSQLEQVLATCVGTTARGRQLEALLQRRLLSSRIMLVSWCDAAHQHFGLGGPGSELGSRLQDGSAEQMDAVGAAEVAAAAVGAASAQAPAPSLDAEAARLRETAAFLLDLADRLQGG